MMTKFNGNKIEYTVEDIALAFTVKTSNASTLEDFFDDLANNIKEVNELKDKGEWLY